jgi:hypothetical protein
MLLAVGCVPRLKMCETGTVGTHLVLTKIYAPARKKETASKEKKQEKEEKKQPKEKEHSCSSFCLVLFLLLSVFYDPTGIIARKENSKHKHSPKQSIKLSKTEQ